METWLPIVLAILTLLGGSGWVKVYLDSRAQRRRDFLLPLEGFFNSTRTIQSELVDDVDFSNLERDPRALRSHFQSLPSEDPRRLLWRARIDRLRDENRRALDLIERHRGDILTDRFRDACDALRAHALAWDDLWRAVESPGPEPSVEESEEVRERLFTEPFPDDLEPALKRELAEVRARAGI
jgi:hypothetical protein